MKLQSCSAGICIALRCVSGWVSLEGEAMASLEDVATVLGVSVPVARFLLCFVGSIPCSAIARFTPAGRVRNLYAAATGIVLSYYSFGSEANLFFIPPIVVGYGSMVLARPHCGAITFFVAFGFLLTWYVRWGVNNHRLFEVVLEMLASGLRFACYVHCGNWLK